MDLSTRRWKVGDKGMVSGIPYRIVQGRKAADDLVIELYANGRWRRVGMEVGFLLADFFADNEDRVLYPNDRARRVAAGGGEYYMSECWRAVKDGWQSAAQKLRLERAARVCRNLFTPRADGTM